MHRNVAATVSPHVEIRCRNITVLHPWAFETDLRPKFENVCLSIFQALNA